MAHAEDVLSRAPLFETLDDEGARALRAGVADVQLARGDRLFDEGDAGDRLYVVLDGKIKLTRTASDGRENLLSVLGPGEMFGELSLFDPRPRTASAVAVTDSKLAGLVKEQKDVAVVDFNNEEGVVKPGARVQQVAIKTGEVRNVVAIPVDAVDQDKSGRPTVSVLRNGQWQPVVVDAGITDGKYIQIKSGIQPGETVKVTPDLLHAASR